MSEASDRADGWTIGWLGGAAVVVTAATLLVTIIGLARRITRQAEEITAALDGVELHTRPLWKVSEVNAALSQVVDRLSPAADGQAS